MSADYKEERIAVIVLQVDLGETYMYFAGHFWQKEMDGKERRTSQMVCENHPAAK